MTVPWVIGQWVRGPLFYGREAEIAALRGALRSAAGRFQWVAGLRRIGKTSLLRQLELLALEDPGPGGPLVPVFWDLQGADRPGEIDRSFGDALLDAEQTLARFGIPLHAVEDREVDAAFARLHGALGRRGARLLLLCDEADQLVGLARDEPEWIRWMWSSAAGIAGRVVIVSSVRLADLAAAGGAAAAAVAGFGAPLLLGALTAGEARSLLRQDRLPEAGRPRFDEPTVEAIRERCGDHPMLLQLAGRRCQECGDPGLALGALAGDRAVEHLFAVDLELLTAGERRALEEIAAAGVAAGAGDPALARLLALGLLRRTAGAAEDGGVEIRNRLLAAWLRR